MNPMSSDCRQLMADAADFMKHSLWGTFDRIGLRATLQDPRTAEEVAAEHQLNPDATFRFLNAMAFLSLVERDASGKYRVREGVSLPPLRSPILFELNRSHVFAFLAQASQTWEDTQTLSDGATLNKAVANGWLSSEEDRLAIRPELAEYLNPESKSSIGPRLVHFEKILAPMFEPSIFEEALRSGKSQWKRAFGTDSGTAFSLYRDQPLLLDTLMRAMHNLNVGDDAELAMRANLNGVRSVLDVGGGTGAWAIELSRFQPTLTQIDIFELPEAIPVLRPIFEEFGGSAERVSYVSGSFAESNSEGGLKGLAAGTRYDRVFLGWILHDWSDETSVEILQRVRPHLTPEGRVVLLELLLPPDKIGPATMLDMAMLVQTEGRERTLSEYRQLLERAGFRNVEHTTSETRRQWIEASP